MLNFVTYAMVYLGSALMVYNVYSYIRFAMRMEKMEHWGRERSLLYIPIILLVFFLLGYLAVGLFGKPTLIVSGILFGGSIFVFVIFYLLQRIANRIQENERLEAKLMAAEASNRVKSSFLSSVGHEMRTPMNAIIGLDDLALKNHQLPEETRGQLEKIGVSARHLLGLIDNMLEMSHMESGSVALKKESFYLRPALEPLLAVIRKSCEEKGLEFEIRDEDPDSCYSGEPAKLRQMLLGILENAVKFTPAPGKVTFTVERLPADGEKRPLRFIIADTGIGIDEEFMPRLFEPFAQEDASSTNLYGGSGLGLAVARNVANLMEGNITAQSEKGKGSTFTVSVVLYACPEENCPMKDAANAPGDGAQSLGGRRILIAEDIDLNAEILSDILEMEDMESERAENGRVAVDMFSRSDEKYYDAVLMDLRMPVMDGLDAARAIRALDRPDARTVPIIALTANALEEDERHVLEAGMNLHLSKPVDAELLYQTLRRLIPGKCDACDAQCATK